MAVLFRSLVLISLVAACSSGPAGRQFHATLARGEGEHTLPLVLGDETGLVTSIEPETASGSDEPPSIRADPSDPNAFYVEWLGGVCEQEADIAFKPAVQGYTLEVSFQQGFGSCPAVGISMGVRVSTSTPVSLSTITVIR